jgi:hypothetical protein
MRRLMGMVLVAVVTGGCTSSRVMRRDECWVRQTEKWPSQVSEEMGPCTRPAPKWSDDRLTRLVQECVAQADYRWQTRAMEAWRLGQPLPPQESEEKLQEVCMGEAARTMVVENEALKERVGELAGERDGLRVSVQRSEEHLRTSHERLATALGEAAKKPAGSAVATATSDSKSTTQSDSTASPAVLEGPSVAQPVRRTSPVRVKKPAAPAAACELPAKKAAEPSAPASAPAVQPKVVKVERPAPAAPAPECGASPKATEGQ